MGMTLDDAIKHAETVAEEHTKYNIYGGFESCDECAKEHRQLAEWLKELKRLREETRWISISERLPENRNQEVLISLEWGIDIGRYSDGEWHSEWINHYDDGNVLAWMPLPEPYKAD